jgi:hypothetical protein
MNLTTTTTKKANRLLDAIDRSDPRQVAIGLMLLRAREKRKRAELERKRGRK